MSLIAMSVFDTIENKRTEYTKRTVNSLFNTVDFMKDRLIISDNGSCQETLDFYKDVQNEFIGALENAPKIIYNGKNLGTAEAINLAWKERLPGEHCIKMDNDVVINYDIYINHKGWVREMEEVIEREPKIGQVGLKRKDLMESPTVPDPHFRSRLVMLPHTNGQRWITVEVCNHILGSCVMHSSALLDKVGYLYQLGVYGFDDSFMSLRSQKAGFMNVFLPHIDIDHIDDGSNPYTEEKRKLADAVWADYQIIAREYVSGKRNVYYNPFINGK